MGIGDWGFRLYQQQGGPRKGLPGATAQDRSGVFRLLSAARCRGGTLSEV